jgi:hypothetical protein
MPTMETLIIAAVGGVTSLVGKYILDRFTESHKATVAIAAKRRERYHEKQATAIAGTYEKLTTYVDAACGLYLYETAVLATEQEDRIKEELDGANHARLDFQKYFAANEIYFPTTLAVKVDQLSRDLHRAILTHRMMTGPRPMGQDASKDKDVAKIKETRDAAKGLLEELKGKFRELLLGDEQPPVPRSAIPTLNTHSHLFF